MMDKQTKDEVVSLLERAVQRLTAYDDHGKRVLQSISQDLYHLNSNKTGEVAAKIAEMITYHSGDLYGGPFRSPPEITRVHRPHVTKNAVSFRVISGGDTYRVSVKRLED
jgi:hypothetical protein